MSKHFLSEGNYAVAGHPESNTGSLVIVTMTKSFIPVSVNINARGERCEEASIIEKYYLK